jgi:ribulose 1,5-bisphosphate carboxylase large subunit-like protein
VIRATFELEPAGDAGVLETLGGAVVEGEGGRVTVDLPVEDWNDDVTLLLAAVVAGEVMELGRLARCRLVELVFPDGLLPGPAFGAPVEDVVGVIVKPALGLSPAEVGDVARAAVAGGARFLKDDEIAGDRPSCPLAERVRAVAKALEPGVVYCPNVTGPPLGLLERARAAVDLGATGLLVDPFAQGLGSLLALREAGLGVPIFAHRAGSGPWARNRDFGPTGAVLARLLRLCGADYIIAGGFGGTLFETEDEVRANLRAIRGPCAGARPAVAALGGGLGPQDVRGQVDAAGPGGLLVLLGSAAYRWPGGLEAGVAAAVGCL